MKKFFKMTAAVFATALLLGGFVACSDDDDDDSSTPAGGGESLSTVSVLQGAYLDGLAEITIPVELKEDAESVLTQGKDVSEYFTDTSSARAVSTNFLTDFIATVSKLTEKGIIITLSGKLKASDYSLALRAAIPAAYTKSGSAASVDALTVNVGSAAKVSEDSLDLSQETVPTAADLAGKTFKYTEVNSDTGYKIRYYQFDADGATATQTTVETDTEEQVKNRKVTFTGVPYNSTDGSLPICHQGHGENKKSEYDYNSDDFDKDSMTLCKIGGRYYLYSEGTFKAEKSDTLFTTYAMLEDGEEEGSYITLQKDGSITGRYEDEKEDKEDKTKKIKITGSYTGSFVNNNGVIMLSFDMKPDDSDESEDGLVQSLIYNGTNLLDGGEFTEYAGTIQ